MDVLNTTGGGFSVLAVIMFGACTVIDVVLICIAIRDRGIRTVMASFALLFIVITCGFFTCIRPPIHYEVTLRSGQTIDTQKYRVLEQRGEIYVIEERK